MKDSELQGIVLRFLYENRRNPSIVFGDESKNFKGSLEIPGSIDPSDWLRACGQLDDYGLIYWKPLQDHTGLGVLGGVAKINAHGTAVVEGDEEPPGRIALVDQRQYVQIIGSQGVQVAGHNSQQSQNISDAFEKVINAIDGATVTEAEKEKAKSFLAKVIKSPVGEALLGVGVKGLLKLLGV